jgi:hypothetical protein
VHYRPIQDGWDGFALGAADDLIVEIGYELGRAAAILAPDDQRTIAPRPGYDLISLFEDLGADAELIWILASFRDTLSDQEVLVALCRWNERRKPSAQWHRKLHQR